MSSHTVAAVMLVNGRDAMTRRAVECVRQQNYPSLRLVVLDTGAKPVALPQDCFAWQWRPELANRTIGTLRNLANALAEDAEIIAHFDSDDWSHPLRLVEQVNFLAASGADAVGYQQALFWDERKSKPRFYWNEDPRYCLGASLCYWRRVWLAKPFEDTSQGEDFRWCAGLATRGVPSLAREPRLVCRLHDGNTSTAYSEATLRAASEWTVAPAWEEYARKAVAL